MSGELDLIRLSQSHLNLLNICPPKFQQVYLDCISPLRDPNQEESMKWGSRFHLLMQQRELALPIESLLETDSELDLSLTALIDAIPNILLHQANVWREAEHCRTLSVGKFLLTVIYDLLIAEIDQATILDWKTYSQPQLTSKLAHNWQTRLYLYVLAKTSEYAPEQIKMTYWFVKSGKPKNVTFNYSQLQHQQTEQDLANLLSNLRIWWQDYQHSQIDPETPVTAARKAKQGGHGGHMRASPLSHKPLLQDSVGGGTPLELHGAKAFVEQFGTVARTRCNGDLPHRPDCQQNCPYRQLLSEESQENDLHQECITSIEEIDEISI